MTVAKITKALLRSVFVSCPTSPELGKWTKFGPALDHIILGGCFMYPLYGHVYKLSFAGGKTERASALGQHTAVGAQAELAFDEEMNWQSVKGKRAKVSVSLLSDRISMARFMALAIAAEVFRAILRVLFAFSGADSASPQPSKHADRVPPFLHFISEQFSPLTSLARYISSSLSKPSGSRLALLLRICEGCTPSELWTSFKDVALALRRSMFLS